MSLSKKTLEIVVAIEMRVIENFSYLVGGRLKAEEFRDLKLLQRNNKILNRNQKQDLM